MTGKEELKKNDWKRGKITEKRKTRKMTGTEEKTKMTGKEERKMTGRRKITDIEEKMKK